MADKAMPRPECSKRETAISTLQHAIEVGILSGPAKPFNPVLFKQKMRKSRD